MALGIAGVVFAATSSSCSGDQLKELAEKAGIRILADGESSPGAEEDARSNMPLKGMTQENRQRAQQIIKERSQFRRLPSLQYTIDEPMFRYLLRHPDVAVSTWRVMGISRFEMWQTGEMEYEAQAIDGSEGIADILYQDDNQMVFVCQGSYHNPLLPRPMEASALIWFRAVYAPNAEGTHVVTQKADVFVRFPSSGVSAIAKVLTPVLHSLMDRNLFEISLYGSMMSRAVRDEPEWVVQVAQQMEGVLPQRKAELIEVARKPRNVNRNGTVGGATIPAADRKMIQSPQLLFLDPPKETEVAAVSAVSVLPITGSRASGPVTENASATGKNKLPVRTVSTSSPGNLTLITIKGPLASDSPKPVGNPGPPREQTKRSDGGFILQPVVVPPTGPTATGPVGSESPGSAE
ncbi:MAG: hypothetical protein WKF77_11535 [Planctomycetaceae bacterium]